MPYLETTFDCIKAFAELRNSLEAADSKKDAPALAITGLSDVHKSHMCKALCTETGRMCVYIASGSQEAGRCYEDMTAMGARVRLYPVRDYSFYAIEGQSRDFEHTRIDTLCAMLDGNVDIVITTADAAMQLIQPPEQLEKSTATITAGDEFSMKKLILTLSAGGYERAEAVEGTGQYSVRGGIIDFFPPSSEYPVRVEFFGDEVDTIRYFEAESQRRLETIKSTRIYPAEELSIGDKEDFRAGISAVIEGLKGEACAKAKARLQQELDAILGGLVPASCDKYIPILCTREATLLDYLPDNGYIVVSEHTSALQLADGYEKRMDEEVKSLIEDGILCKGLSRFNLSTAELWSRFGGHTVFVDCFQSGRYGYDIPVRPLPNVEANLMPAWDGTMSVLVEDLRDLLSINRAVVIMAGTDKGADNLCSDLAEEGIEAIRADEPDMLISGKVVVMPGGLSSGFEYPVTGVTVITSFNGSLVRAARKNKPHFKRGTELQSLSELNVGDYIVHIEFGIGIYGGVVQLEDCEYNLRDYIKISYAKGDIAYVPITQLDMVSKYVGSTEDGKVKISTMGGSDWQRKKNRVRKAVRDIAKELIKIYAARMAAVGYAFPPDSEFQRDFEARFEFDETDDQKRSINEIKKDMESPAPMERLLCGDVGFGKTEVALRAAFKCMAEGRQVVLLAPTTILAWQHYQTALHRFDGFPFRIDLLSRFRTPSQQAQTIEALRRGQVDMVIGTHRLLSKDIQFRDLGLSIIDEEQRFGVEHKEKFKSMFAAVDQLMLTATPIPRTLNMAMSGLRDISTLEEAPVNRLPVQTYVMAHDPAIIADAIKRELRRGGQVYYLHNRVSDIEKVAADLHKLVPEAEIGIAHGQMTENQISKEWKRLVDHEIDILLCTTIIEAGVDVANANTLIVENADCFGLSQLHQIRGRVGRSSRRAYAYFTFQQGKELTEIASKRLSAIRQFTEFGSGMKIATRDLELRGAGNLLGAEQSGHLDSVGYDLYMKLLREAVALEKGEKLDHAVESTCKIDIPVNASIPEEYIDSTRLRLDVYRSIADIRSDEDAADVLDELVDRFGEVPSAVDCLVKVALLRVKAEKMGISEIRYSFGNLLVFITETDQEKIMKMVCSLPGKVLLTAGVKPYFTVKTNSKYTALENASMTIEAFEKALSTPSKK